MRKRFFAFICFLMSGLASGFSPVVVNVDSPGFRPMIAAVPDFVIEGKSNDNLSFWAKSASEELASLLEFTGYFSVMAKTAYDTFDIKKSLESKTLVGLSGIDLPQWKAIRVESLTIAKISMESPSGYRIELRTADITQGVAVTDRSYVFDNKQELDAILRRYVDRVLTAYTGKPGIYSSRIVFLGRKKQGAEKQVFTCDIDGRNLRQITFSNTDHLSPSWSPDGTKILFTSFAAKKADLYQIDLMTSRTTKVAGDRGTNSGGVYSPNGKVIVYSRSVDGNTTVYEAKPDGSNPLPLLTGHGIDVDMTFSPDMQWLAFASARFGLPHIFRAKLSWNPDQTQVRVVEDQQLTFAGYYNTNPAWSPDSKKLAYAGFDSAIKRFDIFIIDPDGKNLERLTLESGNNESPSWSPNGQLIIFHSNRIGNTNQRGPGRLFIMNRDGSKQRPLPIEGLYEAVTPKWGPYLASEK